MTNAYINLKIELKIQALEKGYYISQSPNHVIIISININIIIDLVKISLRIL